MSVDIIQKMVWELATIIDAPKSLTVIYYTSPQNGSPHIEIHGDEFHLVFEERGRVFDKKKTQYLDQLLFWIFCSITFEMAQKYELQHRHSNQDCRRILFAKQLDLIKKISEYWHILLKNEIDEIIAENPYVDCNG